MAPFLYRLLTFSICFKAMIGEVGYGTCDQTFHIFKNTQASSDSERECKNGYNIFPYIHDEGANKFQDGLCAYQWCVFVCLIKYRLYLQNIVYIHSKLQLPDTCFAVHAPQTMQHDEGLLSIHILEKK
eukprot:846133_1